VSIGLAVIGVVARALRRRDLSKEGWPSLVVTVFWTWPICLWCLESLRLMHWLFLTSHSCGFFAYSNYLPKWQTALFCSFYVLFLATSATAVSLRTALDRSLRDDANGPLGWSLRFGVFSVLLLTCGFFVTWVVVP
jgi:hypothetical protein